MHFIFNRSKIAALYISEETIEVAFFVKGLEILQIQGVEMSTGGSTESNVRSFEAFLMIYLFNNNYTKYLIIKLSLLKKPLKSEITKLL
jgi:hypothetical protein